MSKLVVEGPSGTDVPVKGTSSGGVSINAAIRHSRELELATSAAAAQTADSTAAGASLVEGACDCLQVLTDDTVVYRQPPERASILAQTVAGWPAVAGWTYAGTVATHANGGGVTPLTQDTATSHAADPLIPTRYYCVRFKITGYVSGTVTPKLGTTAGTARSANGTYIEIIQSQARTVLFTPTNDFVGSIDVAEVWALPPSPPYKAGSWIPESAVKVVCAVASTVPATIITTSVWAGWYKRAGSSEVL